MKPAQSIAFCFSESSSDVTNIPLGCCEPQFPKIERPRGPLGTGAIWLQPPPHGHPWRLNVSIYHFCLFVQNPNSITIAMRLLPKAPETSSFHRLPERMILCMTVDFEVLKLCVCVCVRTCPPSGVASTCQHEL